MIYIVSHGDTICTKAPGENNIDIACGWLNVPLTERGRREAKRLGQFLKSKELDLLVTSDLQRAAETAEGISKVIGVPVAGRYKELRPWNLGVFSGRPSTQVHKVIIDYIRDPKLRIDGGESLQQFYERYILALKVLMDACRRGDVGNVAVIAHSRNLDLAKGWIDAGATDRVDLSQMLADPTKAATVLLLDPDESGRWAAKVIEKQD